MNLTGGGRRFLWIKEEAIMLKPVKIAILSCNHGHAKGYYPLLTDPMFELVAVSIVPGYEGGEKMETIAHLPTYSTDEALFDNHPELEAVILASDNISHMRQVREAVKRGLHIFSMKIPTFDMQEYAEMRQLAESAGLVYQVELEMRHHAPIYRVKELLEDGAIGELLAINLVNYSHNPVCWWPWMCDPEQSYGKRVPLRPGDERFRGGALADHPHVFDVIRYITDSEFDMLYANVTPNIRESVETEDMVKIIGRLKNGVNFSIDPSYANNECQEKIRVGVKNPKPVEVFLTAVGTRGTIVADLYGKTFCSQMKPRGEYYCAGLGSSGLWNRRTCEFYHCIRSGQKPTVGLPEHENTIRAMNAAYDSICMGQAVKV